MPEVKTQTPEAWAANTHALTRKGSGGDATSSLMTLGSAAALSVDTDPTMAADADALVPSQKAVKAALASLQGEIANLDYSSIGGLDSGEAGALYADALINNLSLTPGQGVMVAAGGSDFEPAPFGTAAFVDALPSGAPPTASSSSGAVTLNYAGQWIIATEQTEEIDDITLSGIADYATVLWQVQTTADGITFPASVTRITGGSLAVTTTAGAAMVFLIQSVGDGEYWVFSATAEAVA